MQQEDVPVARLLDHLVGAGEQRRRHVEAKRLRSLEIKYEFDLGRRLDGQVGGFLTLENPINVGGCAPVWIERIRAKREKAAAMDEVAIGVDGRHPMASSTIDYQTTLREKL